MDALDQFVEAAEQRPVMEIFAALDALTQQEVGAIIFSCSTFDAETRQAKRIYTNQAEAYPVSGLKDIVPNIWTATVLDKGETFVANTIEDIAEVFPDHELIASLGCGSVINVPIKLSGVMMGTINLLHETGYYTDSRLVRTAKLRPAAMLAFAAMQRNEEYAEI